MFERPSDRESVKQVHDLYFKKQNPIPSSRPVPKQPKWGRKEKLITILFPFAVILFFLLIIRVGAQTEPTSCVSVNPGGATRFAMRYLPPSEQIVDLVDHSLDQGWPNEQRPWLDVSYGVRDPATEGGRSTRVDCATGHEVPAGLLGEGYGVPAPLHGGERAKLRAQGECQSRINRGERVYWEEEHGHCHDLPPDEEAKKAAREAAEERARKEQAWSDYEYQKNLAETNCASAGISPCPLPTKPPFPKPCRHSTNPRVSSDCGIGHHITPVPQAHLIVGPAPIAPKDREEILRRGQEDNRRRGGGDDDDDEDDQEELDRRIREGASRGQDVDKEKTEYRKKYGNPCRWVNGRVVCIH